MSEDSKRTFTTNKVRIVYPNLFKRGGSKEKFGVQVLVPKTDTETCEKMLTAFKTAVEDKWPSKRPHKIERPFKDGDSEEFEGHSLYDAYKGHYVLQCGSQANYGNSTLKHIPVVDQNLQVVADAGELNIKGGDYCKIVVNMYATDNQSNRVVALAKCVQFIASGESLGFTEPPLEAIMKQFLKKEVVGDDPLGLIADTMNENERDLLKEIL